MKNNIKLLLAAGLGACATSCTDLDVTVESQYTEYPNNEIAIEAKMADVYFQMRGPLGRRVSEAVCFSSDEYVAVCYDGGYYDGGHCQRATFHNFGTEDPTLDWFGTVSEGIAKANKAIVDLGGPSAGSAAAGARAVRAYYHFVLMDGWGDVPILDRTPEDGEVVARQPRAEVAKFIESELLDVLDDLTTDVTPNTYGKPTRWMAEALLAKLYINWAVYTASSVDQYDAATAKNEKLADCIKVCDDIINSGKFNLGTGKYAHFAQKFGPKNGPDCEDFIYAMPYDTYTQQGMIYGRFRSWKGLKKLATGYYGMALSQSTGGYAAMTPEFSDLFCLEGDVRNELVLKGEVHVFDPETLRPTDKVALDQNGNPIVLTREITLKGDPNDETLDVGESITGYNQGNRSVKFFVIDDDFKNGRNQSNDVPIFRYADILLMKAEAIVRGGGNGDAKALFNEVRAYAQAPLLSATPTLDEIYDERGREFLDENWRRNDMIRFGHYEDEYYPHYKSNPNANFDKTKRIWPIHRDILNLNPTWKQNPGY
ncbi:MAG: RagB/SusD family nutrient uptake outer membrane protein [Bacteroidia bacterium]|nr:RagB/SusD family nutrient uptake outer membrane protein [Bacteroidia bacterium]